MIYALYLYVKGQKMMKTDNTKKAQEKRKGVCLCRALENVVVLPECRRNGFR